MKVALTERFQRAACSLDDPERVAVFDALLALPRALGESHAHSGLGIRKLHPSGIWEARVGLALRLVFALQPGLLTLVTVGRHDEVRRFLRDL
jgi:mRNA-degrading endonuclease YafQ of YafQ-DinJ toxin-antitoxin module